MLSNPVAASPDTHGDCLGTLGYHSGQAGAVKTSSWHPTSDQVCRGLEPLMPCATSAEATLHSMEG